MECLILFQEIPVETQEDVQQKRLQRLHDVCERNNGSDAILQQRYTGRIWSYQKLNVHYCYVAKVGCTHWKQVLRFVSGEYPKHLKPEKPSDLNREMVHLPPGPRLRVSLLNKKPTRTDMSNGHSFLFARNPYARLWSAYLDKIFLPEYWNLHGYSILMAADVPKTDPRHKCGNDTTFQEFLTFITKIQYQVVDEHWQTIINVCAPCTIRYEAIGKMESFAKDAEYILDKFNMTFPSGTKSEMSPIEHAYHEVEMLTRYNFHLPIPLKKGCLTDNVTANKLWKAFQYNGYLHRDIGIPWDDMVKHNFSLNPPEVFLETVLRTLRFQETGGLSTKGQKKALLIEAYKAIPSDLISKIQDIFKLDFEMFGYSRSVSDI